MDGFSFKRIVRRPWLSALSFVIFAAVCFLLCTLTNYRSAQKDNIEQIRKTYDVRCVVTDLRGTKSSGLGLAPRYWDFIMDEEKGLGSFVKELLLTKCFDGSGDMGTVTVIGVTSPKCVEEMDPALGGDHYSEIEDFFDYNGNVCLVSRDIYEEYKGRQIVLTVSDPMGESMGEGAGTGTSTLNVVGWYKGTGLIVIPYPFSQRLGSRLAGNPSTDSVAFLLNDNDSGERLMEAASPMFSAVDPSSTKQGYFALTVQDEQYRATIASAQQDISRTELLMPLITLLGLGAGFLLGFLATRNETKNYALMRTLGITAGRLTATVLFEQQILPLAACAGVGAAAGQPLPAALIFGCGLVGCTAAVMKQVLTPAARLLKNRE